MKKILAVSGGIDSMVMLHIFKNVEKDDVIVAHFNHGTRPSADSDQEFVKQKAAEYGLAFKTAKMNLGAGVSEEKARAARYDFLHSLAQKYQGKIYTAHHINDLVESVCINLVRGTGWRGLVPLDTEDIVRPLLDKKFTKRDVLRYAAENNLAYREDPTNHEPNYLRNRIREKFAELDINSQSKLENEIYDLWQKQKQIKAEISAVENTIISLDLTFQRALFKGLDDATAIEILKVALAKASISATRPQIQDFLQAIRTYQPEKSFNLPGNKLVTIHKTYFKIA